MGWRREKVEQITARFAAERAISGYATAVAVAAWRFLKREAGMRGGQGITWVGVTVVPARVNSNRRVQVLRMLWPETFGGRKPQCCAACIAKVEKYLLGPGAESSANCTSPDVSTSTLTVTLTVP